VAVAVLAIACVGKGAACALAARVNGEDWRHSLAIGTLMNARGMMELIILTIGLERGIITPTLFTMMVLMALVTTIATTPVLRLMGVGELPATVRSEAHPAAPDVHGARDVRGVGP
jgi:Kef-type K+ transport system membrane component KefB